MTDKSQQHCNQLAEPLSAYLDGQLPDDQAARVEDHLKACSACAQKLEHYRQIRHLMQAEPAKCPIDLTGAVLANLEREQLLTGLDDMAKPPPVLRSRLLRGLAAAAMIGLVIYAGSIIFQFSSGSHDRVLSKNRPTQDYKSFAQAERRPDTTSAFVPAKPSGAAAVIHHAVPAVSGAGGPAAENRPLPAPPGLAPRLKAVKESHRSEFNVEDMSKSSALYAMPAAESPPRELIAKDSFVDADMTNFSSTRPAIPPAFGGALGTQVDKERAERSFARQFPLVFTLSAPDMPTWMLAKEQVLQALIQDQVAPVAEPDQLRDAIAANRPSYFQARKGLELSAGSTRGQIVAVVTGRQFVVFHARLQQPDLESIQQTLHPELKRLLDNLTMTPALATLTAQTTRNLNRYLVRRGISQALAETTQPAATRPAAVPVTPVAPEAFADRSSSFVPGSAGERSLPASAIREKVPAASVRRTDTAPAEGLVPVLIDIELVPPKPATRPVGS